MTFEPGPLLPTCWAHWHVYGRIELLWKQAYWIVYQWNLLIEKTVQPAKTLWNGKPRNHLGYLCCQIFPAGVIVFVIMQLLMVDRGSLWIDMQPGKGRVWCITPWWFPMLCPQCSCYTCGRKGLLMGTTGVSHARDVWKCELIWKILLINTKYWLQLFLKFSIFHIEP